MSRIQAHTMTEAQTKAARTALCTVINEAFKGNRADFARRMGRSAQAIWYWINEGVVPPTKVQEICWLSSGAYSPEDFRPDVYLPYSPRKKKAA
jgi:DNA-binding transcriptional regulator YdaS (Cro superfamily)